MAKKVEPRVHPAPFSEAVLATISLIVDTEADRLRKKRLRVLDPFAGVGWIHTLDHDTVGIEIEPEWACQHPRTKLGDSTKLRYKETFDVVATSPCYGNRMADHHDAKDICKKCHNKRKLRVDCKTCKGTGLSHRRTYKHYLGHDLSPNNAGAMQWGDDYRELHTKVWAKSVTALKPGGLFVLNIRNHFRTFNKKVGPVEQHVAEWHLQTLGQLGLAIQQYHFVETPGYRFGENRELRLAGEQVIELRKVA